MMGFLFIFYGILRSLYKIIRFISYSITNERFFRKIHIVYRAAQAVSVRILHKGAYFCGLDRAMAQGFCVPFRPNPATLKLKSGMNLSSEGDSCTYSKQLRKAEFPSYGSIVKTKIKNYYVYNIFK